MCALDDWKEASTAGLETMSDTGDVVVFEHRPAENMTPTIIIGDAHYRDGSKSHCREVNCRWLCWHHAHAGPFHFTCFGSDLRLFADQGCASCAVLRHLIETTSGHFYEGDTCQVFMDEDYTVRHVKLENRRIKSRRPPLQLCAAPFIRPNLLPETGEYRFATKDQAFMPLREPTGSIYADPRCEEAVSLFCRWFRDCKAKHVKCQRADPNSLPSRVLDVGQGGEEDLVRLRQSDDLHGDYIALSYCWGSKPPPRTLRSTLREHQAGMPLSSLPATFSDAVWVARALSVPYLWIDALCIVQDDDQDRDFELARMDQIFRGATLVVIAASGKTPYDGFLRGRQPDHMWSPAAIRLEDGRTQQVVFRNNRGLHFGIDACESDDISRRAWTLQERLLARRCLIFKRFECVWECRHGCRCECLADSCGYVPQLVHFEDALSPDKKDTVAAAYELWKTTVADHYSKRLLTFQEDKLPAIGAIARYVAELTRDQYIAGCWKRDILPQLLWSPLSDAKLPRESTKYTAPSWSWASSMVQVRFQEPYARSPYEAEVIEASSQASNLNPYGAIESAHIILGGFSSWAVLTVWDGDDCDDVRHTLELLQGNQFKLHNFFPPNPLPCQRLIELDEKSPRIVLAPRGEVSEDLYEYQNPCSGLVTLFWIFEAWCLVLVPSPEIPDAFERIGLVRLYAQLDEFGEVPAYWKLTKRTVKIV